MPSWYHVTTLSESPVTDENQIRDSNWLDVNQVEYLLNCLNSDVPPGFVLLAPNPKIIRMRKVFFTESDLHSKPE